MFFILHKLRKVNKNASDFILSLSFVFIYLQRSVRIQLRVFLITYLSALIGYCVIAQAGNQHENTIFSSEMLYISG